MFRIIFIFLINVFILFCSTLNGSEGEINFSKKPTITKKGTGFEIAFSVESFSDVTIAIKNKDGEIIRHLGSGLLGNNPPALFQPDSKSQVVYWDGKDNSGNLFEGSFSVEVSLGLEFELLRYLGHDDQVIGADVTGISIAPDGDLYLMGSENSWGRSWLKRFDSQGKYKNTLIPFAANTPKERIKEFHPFEIDGEMIPLVTNAQNGSTQDYMSALKDQSMAFDKNGNVIIASAIGSLSNHGPAQYLLKVHPEGGHPVEGYIGTSLLGARGFIGGSGESTVNVFTSIATDKNKEWIYLHNHIKAWSFDKQRDHGIYRLKWGDKKLPDNFFIGHKEAGEDDDHLNFPIGMAIDTKGNIYVCDNGNNRLMIYSEEGKLIKKVSIPLVHQVQVHPKTGEIYVLCRDAMQNPTKKPESYVKKFTSLGSGEEIKEVWSVASLEIKPRQRYSYKMMALGFKNNVPAVWVVQTTGWRRPDLVYPILDKGETYEVDQPLNHLEGLCFPLYVSTDEKRNKLYVKNFMKDGFRRIDLTSGEIDYLNIRADELVVGPNGDLLGPTGWSVVMNRYDEKGQKVAFPGSPKGLGPWVLGKDGKNEDILARVKGFGQGGRGYTYDTQGNFYVIKMGQYQNAQVDKYSSDGVLVQEKLIDNLPYGSGGIAVDTEGNIYVGVSARPLSDSEKFWPHGFDALIPKDGWLYYNKSRPAPWDRVYYNTYLFYWGSVIKFGAEGGRFYSWRPEGYKEKSGSIPLVKPEGVPANSMMFRTGYLNVIHAVSGAKWLYNGCSPIPTGGESWGDPSCSCWNIRLCTDEFDRVFVPNGFRFSVEVIDKQGNQISRIGRYDNRDSLKRDPKKIAFAWPFSVSGMKDRVYVCDMVNNRIAEIKQKYKVTETIEIKK